MRRAIALDVGGTTIKYGIVSEDGVLCAASSTPTPRSPQKLIETAATLVADLKTQAASTALQDDAGRTVSAAEIISPIGFVIPGIIDAANGYSVFAANLGWENLPLRDLLSGATGLPVAFGHDVRSGAYGESRWGAGSKECFYVAVGTGVAAVAIVHGYPLYADGWGGEIGQLIVTDPDRPELQVPIEQVVSAAAIARRYRARKPGVISDNAGSREVFALAREGDSDALDIIHFAIDRLARLVAGAMATIGSVRVVVGGGIIAAGDVFFGRFEQSLRSRLGAYPTPEVVPAQLGSWAQTFGAGALALDADAGASHPYLSPAQLAKAVIPTVTDTTSIALASAHTAPASGTPKSRPITSDDHTWARPVSSVYGPGGKPLPGTANPKPPSFRGPR